MFRLLRVIWLQMFFHPRFSKTFCKCKANMGTKTSSSQYKTVIPYKEMNQLAHWLTLLFVNKWDINSGKWLCKQSTIQHSISLFKGICSYLATRGFMFGLILNLSPQSCLIWPGAVWEMSGSHQTNSVSSAVRL